MAETKQIDQMCCDCGYLVRILRAVDETKRRYAVIEGNTCQADCVQVCETATEASARMTRLRREHECEKR